MAVRFALLVVLLPVGLACARRAGPAADVLCGIDVLRAEGFAPLAGRRVGLITNHTGRDADGRRTIDVLAAAPGVRLVKLFSPEHGLAGKLDERVPDGVDEVTGLPVVSLYGGTRRPTREMLAGVDALVFDVQDIGTRFYTYVSTMGLCMEAAAEAGVEFIVLDRPNPIGGCRVEGPVADEGRLSFTAYAPMPIVHGMTAGELARLFNVERRINCRLTVVPLRGWRRGLWWDQTGLMWVNPSPNMRNPTQALLYPGIGLLETANLSVGRGTDQPFELLGAPWIDARPLARALNTACLPGVRFTPVEFTPVASKFAGERCQGLYLAVTDREAFEPVRTGVTIAHHLRAMSGERFHVALVGKLFQNDAALAALVRGDAPREVERGWREPLARFLAVRERYLIYPP